MSQEQSHITDAELGKKICQFKDHEEFEELVDYLVAAIASGSMSCALQAKAYNELGLAHLQLDNPLEAEKSFISAIERSPQSVNPRFNKANLALYAQRFSTALEQYLELLEIAPEHVGAHYHAGLCFAMQEQTTEALEHFLFSVKREPNSMGPNFWTAELLLASKQFDEALQYFMKAAEIMPDHRESQRGIAICHFELEQYTECIAQCDLLILSGSGVEYLAHKLKGDALIQVGEVAEAAANHLELAFMDFDAREFLIMRAKELAQTHPEFVEEYTAVLRCGIPEMESAFDDLLGDSA